MGLKILMRMAIVVGLLATFGIVQDVSAEIVSRDALLASMCSTCHGTDGAGAEPIPRISGKDVTDFVDLMTGFASGERPATIMDRHAPGYSDEEIRALAEYLSQQ